MPPKRTLQQFAADLAAVLPAVDAKTTGQYGDGLGSEDEADQLTALLEALRATNKGYEAVEREVAYPDREASCDLLLQETVPVEAKLLRYWRANGDPEPHMYTHVFSPFTPNTLLTDARRLAATNWTDTTGLLGLFYTRSDDDPESVPELPERFTAADLAEKVVQDIDYWYDIDAEVVRIAEVERLQHSVHGSAAVITWVIHNESAHT